MLRLIFYISFILSITLFAGVGKIEISSTTHEVNVASKETSLIVNWIKPTMTNEDVLQKYLWKFDSNSTSNLESDPDAKEISESATTLTIDISDYADGTYYFHILGVTDQGDTGVDETFGKIIIDRTAPIVSITDTEIDYQAVEVSLSSPENNVKIYYTTDNSEPTTSSNLYSEPFKLYFSTTVKFIVVDSAENISDVIEKSITVNYTGNIAKISNISDNQKIATSSENGADTITPKLIIDSSSNDIQQYKYRFDANTYSDLISVETDIDILNLTDGEHTIYIKGVDSLGNLQAEETAVTFTVDNTAPKTKMYVGNIAVENEAIFGENVEATFVSDENSTVRYLTDGGTPTKTYGTTYNDGIAVVETTEFKFISYDSLGNIGTVSTSKIIIDRTPPTLPEITDINSSAEYNGGLIFNQPTTLNFSTTDNYSENPKVYWTIDGTAPSILTSQSGSVEISKSSTLQFFAVDEVNNSTEIVSKNIIIDQNPPSLPSFVLPNDCILSDGVYTCASQEVNVKLSAIDSETPDVVNIYYTQNGEIPTSSSENISNEQNVTLLLTSNEKTIKFVAVDKVGNRSEIGSFVIKYAPTEINDLLQISTSLSLANGAFINNQNIKEINVTIVNGGENPIYYFKIDDNNFTAQNNSTQPISISDLNDGNHSLSVFASNGEINSTENKIYFYIDSIAPNKPEINATQVFVEKTLVSMFVDDENSTIYYSVNGAEPSELSLIYTSPFEISTTTTLKAIAIDKVGNKSDVITLLLMKYIAPNSSDNNLTDLNSTDNNISSVENNITIDENITENNISENNISDEVEDDSNIVDIQPVLDENNNTLGEELTVENSKGESKKVVVKVPENTETLDNQDGSRTYIFASNDYYQDVTVAPNGAIDANLSNNSGGGVIVNSELESVDIQIKENNIILQTKEPIVSDSGKETTLKISTSSTEVKINMKVNGKDIGFPTIKTKDNEVVQVLIELKENKSLQIELKFPLNSSDLQF